jgi:hypothetical protein
METLLDDHFHRVADRAALCTTMEAMQQASMPAKAVFASATIVAAKAMARPGDRLGGSR